MLKLSTAYPYGLNDWLGDEYKKDNTNVVVGKKFLPLPTKHNRISRSSLHKIKNSLSPGEFLIYLKHYSILTYL